MFVVRCERATNICELSVSMTRSHAQIALFVGGFLVVNAFIFSVAHQQWRSYERLAHVGVHTEGRVTATEPANHNEVRYEFLVGSNTFSGGSSASFGGLPPLYQIRVGDKIPVTYLPANPSVSVPGDPSELYGSWSTLLFLIAPVFGLIAGAVTAWHAGRYFPNS